MTAPIWRVETFKTDRGWGARLLVNDIAFPVCPDAWEWSEAEAQHAVRMAEAAMRAVEVAVPREAKETEELAYAKARDGGCSDFEAYEAGGLAFADMIRARLPDCACATDPASVTHNEGTREHP